MIKLIFLGTSDAIPSIERNTTSILLSYKDENILIDCGEGTQRQLRKANFNPCKITKILISHWHGDHILGLPGLLQTLSFSGYNKSLEIYGPRGTKNLMKALLKTFVFQEKIKLTVKEVENRFFESEDFYLEAEHMTHGTPCNAYTFVKKKSLRIDKKKLEKTKISGPLLKHLKEGKNIVYDGKTYFSKDMTFEETDKKISFVFDTSFNERIIPFVINSDILVCESTFGSELEERAEDYKHLTVKQTARIAKESKSKKLILTHISQRYSKNPQVLLKDAKKIFRNSVLAKDFDRFDI
ncbi:ribonuclease Z [Candidatus Pacearchaeota archaeon]|nr:ribonuclease Z [Candidatus Pacearchaeota archaeon]